MSIRTINNSHGGGSSTVVLELDQFPLQQDIQPIKTQKSLSLRSLNRETKPVDDVDGALPSPVTATERLQRWNASKTLIWRTLAANYSFIIMGANDAAYGPIIPYLETYYNVSYLVISLVFLSPLVGYTLSALGNNYVHLNYGQRGVAFIGASCHLLAYILISIHPPYPALIFIFMLSGFGNGIEDAAWNAWIGNLANANELMGFLHGSYGLGATISPLIATAMITKGGLQWYYFYYIMIGASTIELFACVTSFWTATAQAFRDANPKTSESTKGRMRESLFTQPAARVTWLCAVFLLAYVGTEVALGGWIVTFMIRVRHGSAFSSGMVAMGFWLGMTVGRVTLGFVTPRVGERLAISIYLPIAMALQLLFWLVPQFYVSAVAVSLQGFFLGPLFPAACVAATKLLPRHLHVSAIGFAAAFGGCGAAIFPFAVGAIAQAKGVQVLQPIVLALLCVDLVLWLALPRIGRKAE